MADQAPGGSGLAGAVLIHVWNLESPLLIPCSSNLSFIALPWGGGFNVVDGDKVAFNNTKGSANWTSTLTKNSGEATVSDNFALSKITDLRLSLAHLIWYSSGQVFQPGRVRHRAVWHLGFRTSDFLGHHFGMFDVYELGEVLTSLLASLRK